MPNYNPAIPSFYLRKPWYTLLKHVEKHPSKYVELVDEPVGYRKLQSKTNLREKEQKFYQDLSIKIDIDKVPFLSEKIGDICKKIHNNLGYKGNPQHFQVVLNIKLVELDTESVKVHGSLPVVLCDYVLKILHELYQGEELTNQEEQIKKIQEDYKNKFGLKTETQYSKQLGELWDLDGLPEQLKTTLLGSKYLVYERTDAANKINASRGIAISCLTIDERLNGNESIQVKMDSLYFSNAGKTQANSYTGILGYDSESEYLLFELIRTSNRPTFAFIVARIDSDSPDEQKIMLGYCIFYSIHYQRFLCKVVVLQRYDSKLAEQFDFEPQDIASTDKEDYEKIDLLIRRFLANRAQNRLTMPLKVISRLTGQDKSLEHWLTDHKEFVDNDVILKSLVGSYTLCYFIGENLSESMTDEEIHQLIRKDELIIHYDEVEVQFFAEFQHFRGERPNIYRGKVSRKHYTVEILLNDKFGAKEQTTDVNHVFLTFGIPVFDAYVINQEIKKFPTFKGIISGLDDTGLVPVSFAAILIKRENEIPSDQEMSRDIINTNTLHEMNELENKISNEINLNQYPQVAQFFRLNVKQLSMEMPSQTVDDRFPFFHSWMRNGGKISIQYNENFEVVIEGISANKEEGSWVTSPVKSLDEAQSEANSIIEILYLKRNGLIS